MIDIVMQELDVQSSVDKEYGVYWMCDDPENPEIEYRPSCSIEVRHEATGKLDRGSENTQVEHADGVDELGRYEFVELFVTLSGTGSKGTHRWKRGIYSLTFTLS